MRNQKVCMDFDLLFNRAKMEDQNFFNYFVSYSLGVMKNKIDEYDLELIENVFNVMKKVRKEDPVVDPSTYPPGSITSGILDGDPLVCAICGELYDFDDLFELKGDLVCEGCLVNEEEKLRNAKSEAEDQRYHKAVDELGKKP